jgi:hypothetical protein
MIKPTDDLGELEYHLAELQFIDLVKSFESGTERLAKELRTPSGARSPRRVLADDDVWFADAHGPLNFTGRRLAKILSDPALVIEQKAEACLKVYQELYEPKRFDMGPGLLRFLGDPAREADRAHEEREYEEFKNQLMTVMATVGKAPLPQLMSHLDTRRLEIVRARAKRDLDPSGDRGGFLKDIFGKDRKT